MDYPNLNDEQLLHLLENDDERAFHAIYQLYWKECFTIAYQKLNSKTLAEEATQNIFISLWERRNQVKIQNLQSYLYTSVKYQVLNFIKQKISSEKLSHSLAKQQLSGNKIEEQIFFNDLEIALEKAIQNLPNKTSQIYQLSRYECLTGKEIARRMGLSEKSVEYHITKALKYLRVELKDYLTIMMIIVIFSSSSYFL